MKKFVVLSLVALLVLALGTMAFAQAKKEEPKLDFKASGFIDIISNYMVNVPQAGNSTSAAGATGPVNAFFGPPVSYMMPTAGGLTDKAFDKKMSYMETRGRLKFDAIMGKEMMGTFFFEIDSNRWGDRVEQAGAPVGVGTAAQRNRAGFWGVADRAAIEVKNMFLTFGVPLVPVPITVQGGIIPMAIRPAVFLATDGPGIQAAIKVDPAMIRLIWMKAVENKDWAADDADLYAIEASAKISTMTVGGYVLNFNMNTYPASDGVTPLLTAPAIPPQTASAFPAGSIAWEPNFASNVWWYGIYATGKLGPVNLNADLVINNGKITDRRDLNPQAKDVKLTGWGGLLNVSYPWEKFNFGFATIYGSGADLNKTSASGLPGSSVATSGTGLSGSGTSSKVGAFIVPAGTEGSVGHSIILCGNGIINRNNTGYEQAASSAHAAATFGGMWINKLFGSFQVTPDYKVTLEAMYIRDTTKSGNTIGTAVKNERVALTSVRDDKDIGWEFDLFNEIALYKNLKLAFGGGILFAGDAMDYRVAAPVGFTNVSPKNPWIIATSLTYSF